uniref:Uncharacterized protein n=1 Tax=Trypanosoma congolense (strain IL3000) TaxID=1068625 RepID=G0V0K6_TRYCI|nr:conserved hypothetical protein [Trypanosoma congolense IL3000]
MVEVFRVQLLGSNASKKDGNEQPDLVLHDEINIDRRSVTSGDAGEEEEELTRGSTSIHAMQNWSAAIAIKYIEGDVGEGADGALMSVASHETRDRPLACCRLRGGGRLLMLNPVEDGNYLLAITVPRCIWRWLGSVAFTIVLSTSVRGYEIPYNVASVISVPTYFPLRNRVVENVGAVQEALSERMRQIVEFTTYLSECGKQETSTSAASMHDARVVVMTIQRMHNTIPSHLCHRGRLGIAMQNLLWSATSYSHHISLSGAIGSGGLCKGHKRLVVTASAVWLHGKPIFSSSTPEDFQMYLLPAAVVTYMSRQLTSQSNFLITVKCFALHSRTGADCLRFPGYIKSQSAAEFSSAAICLCFASEEGWIISLLTEVALSEFSGAPISHIISGVTKLITTTFATPRFVNFVNSEDPERLLPIKSSSITTVPFPVIFEALRGIDIFQHCCDNGIHAVNVLQNTSVFHFEKKSSNCEYIDDSFSDPWPNHLGAAATEMTRFAAQSFRHRKRRNDCCIDSGRNCMPSSPTFSVLRSDKAVVVMAALPVCTPRAAVYLVVLDLCSGGTTTSELRAFALWLLMRLV